MVSTQPFLEIILKVGKKLNIHFVKPLLLKKKLPVIFTAISFYQTAKKDTLVRFYSFQGS